MKPRILLSLGLLLSLIVPAEANDLLKPREWGSADGRKLHAELVSWRGEKLALKRAKDGRVFELEISQVSEEDQKVLEEAEDEVDAAVKKALNQPGYDGTRFVGFADPSEEVWEVAYRIGSHRAMWEAITQSGWADPAANNRLLTLKPERMTRDTSGQYSVEGRYVTVIFQVGGAGKLNISGEKLVMIAPGGATRIIAERNKLFTPAAAKQDLIDCAPQKVGTQERLVFTLRVY